MSGKLVRVDWQALSQRSIGASGFLVCIPEKGRDALIGMAERLMWRATWGYPDDADWVEIEDEAAATTYALIRGVNMDDLITELKNINSTLLSLQGSDDNCGCGTEGTFTETELSDESDFPLESNGDVPPAVAAPDGEWSTYASHLCDQAHAIVDGQIAQVEHLRYGIKMFNLGKFIAGIMLAIVGPWVIARYPSAETLVRVSDMLTDLDLNDLDGMETDIEAMREDLVCAIVTAVTPAAAYAAYHTQLEELEREAVVISAFKILAWQGLFQTAFTGVYRGDIATATETGRDCSFCAQPIETLWNNPLLQFGEHSADSGDGRPNCPGWQLWPDTVDWDVAVDKPNYTTENVGLGIDGDGAFYSRPSEVGWYQDVEFPSGGTFAVTMSYRQTGPSLQTKLFMQEDAVTIETMAAASGATSGFNSLDHNFTIPDSGTYRFVWRVDGFGSAYGIVEGFSGSFTPS